MAGYNRWVKLQGKLILLKNIKMQKLLPALFLTLSFSASAIAQTGQVTGQKSAFKKIRDDSASKIEVREFDAEKLNAYRLNRDFNYNDTTPETQGFFSKLWDWFWSLVESVLEDETAGGFIGYAIIAILVLFALYAILRFLGMDLKILSSKSKSIEVPYTESAENIHEISFNEEIEKAIIAKNYRLAVRLAYLKTLKYLNDTRQINWQPDKTNQVYINEITDSTTRATFKGLTTRFEYVWYGEFFLNRDAFNKIKADFDQFNSGK